MNRNAVTYLAKAHRRQMAEALMESMDFCDPTRSHESSPLTRHRMHRAARKSFWIIVGAVAFVMSLAAIGAGA